MARRKKMHDKQPIILKQNKMTKINMHEMMNKYNAK